MSNEEQPIKNPFLQFLVADKWRWGRHVAFLFLVIWVVYNAEPRYAPPWVYYEKGVACFLLLFPFYINLYWLVPRLLFRNKFVSYSAVVVALAILTWLLSLAKHRWMDAHRILPDEMRQNADFLTLLTFAVFLLLPSTAFRLFQRTILDNQRIAGLEKTGIQSELIQLKNQINPHFLLNMLNNVNVLTQQDPEKASQVLHKLSDLLRYQLYDSSREYVMLTADIHFLNDFLNLEKIRRDDFDFILSREGDIGNVRIPPQLFITFIENAVKHNADAELRSYVYVWFCLQGEELHFKCVNSKPRRAAARHKPGGLGLANVRRTLELLYPGKHRLDIHDLPATYTVNLTIQL